MLVQTKRKKIIRLMSNLWKVINLFDLKFCLICWEWNRCCSESATHPLTGTWRRCIATNNKTYHTIIGWTVLICYMWMQFKVIYTAVNHIWVNAKIFTHFVNLSFVFYHFGCCAALISAYVCVCVHVRMMKNSKMKCHSIVVTWALQSVLLFLSLRLAIRRWLVEKNEHCLIASFPHYFRALFLMSSYKFYARCLICGLKMSTKNGHD